MIRIDLLKGLPVIRGGIGVHLDGKVRGVHLCGDVGVCVHGLKFLIIEIYFL